MTLGLPSRIRSALPVCMVVLAACDRPPEPALPDGVSFLERDSAGVRVATTLGTRARAPIGWVVDTVPEYEVGSTEGEEPYLFTWITGARQLLDGRVVILERTNCDFRFFDADGVFLGRAGGFGEGPGEFRSFCFFVDSPGNPNVLLGYDGVRLSFFDDRGRYSHRLRVSWRGRNVPHIRGVAGDQVLASSPFFSNAIGGLPSRPSTADFALLQLGSWRPSWEGFFQGQQVYTVQLSDGTLAGHTLPFDILPEVAMGTDGFYLTLGEDQGPEILEYDAAGSLRRIIRLAEASVAPSPEALDRLAEYRHAGTPEYWRETGIERLRSLFEEMPLPETIPVFSRLLIDEGGLLWAELHRYDVRRPPRWLVFGPNGEGLGSVDMPAGLNVLQIGQDFVLGVWEDELEVQYLRRHPVTGRT